MIFKNYKSHKIVKAVKIVKIEETFDDNQSLLCYLLYDETGTVHKTSNNLFTRGKPQDDYFYLVKYDDKNISWSPKEAFEKGYTEITEKPNRIYPQQIEHLKNQITYQFYKIGEKGTLCEAYLGNFSIAQGYTACVDPKNYSQELGEKYSREKLDKILDDKLWEFMGFSLFKELNPEIFI